MKTKLADGACKWLRCIAHFFFFFLLFLSLLIRLSSFDVSEKGKVCGVAGWANSVTCTTSKKAS
jgi:hypothetical protein